MDYTEFSNSKALVVDNGSSYTRGGISGEDAPKVNIPTLVGRPKFDKIYVGPKENLRGLLRLSSPIERGVVENVEDMYHIWEYAYSELKVQRKETPVILTEPVNNPKSSRRNIAEMFFEKFTAPGLLIVQQPILSLLAQGRTTGTVLESGDGVTQVMPIFEGYSLPNTVERADLGGSDITQYLRLLLKRSGYNFNTPSELEILKSAKESIISCKTTSLAEDEIKKSVEETKQYALPDGSLMNIGSERLKAAEIMFKPSIIGMENMGVHQMIASSIKRVDLDLRESLYKNIFVSGGNTLIQSFMERLKAELQQTVSKTNVSMNIIQSPDRQLNAWKGASILSSMSVMKGVWVQAKNYKEEGDRALTKFSF